MKSDTNMPVYGRPEFTRCAPKDVIPAEPMAPDTAYELIANELLFDGHTGLNLATFCNEAYNDPWGMRLVTENVTKNFIDHEEYPGTNLAEKRSIWMLASELGTEFAPSDTDPDSAEGMYGAATIGSSEAVMLGLIAHRYRWQQAHRERLRAGKADAQDRPVVIMSSHVHGCWDKYCRYYDAVAIYAEIEGPPYAMDGEMVRDILNTPIEDLDSPYARQLRQEIGYLHPQGDRLIGELVMCVGVCTGSTFTGNNDDVKSIDDAVEVFCSETARDLTLDIPLHVDAASSGFVLLFSHRGSEVPFSFRDTKRVRSINISNHKFGMTFPGMGSVIFRDSTVVDPSLVYNITYLGGSFPDYTVNFSRGASAILMQYYNFLRFGRDGYEAIINNCLSNTKFLLDRIRATPILAQTFRNLSDSAHLPIVVLSWNKELAELPEWDLADLSHELRQQGWVVPCYVLPKRSPEEVLTPGEGEQVLRIVIQLVVTADKLDRLVIDMKGAVERLNAHPPKHENRQRRAHKGYKC